MAKITKANSEPLTEQVVERLNEKEQQKELAKREFQNETDCVCNMVKRGKVQHHHPEYFKEDAFVELVAKVPQAVAVEAVRQQRFGEKYPCITSYFFGILTGGFLVAASVFVTVIL